MTNLNNKNQTSAYLRKGILLNYRTLLLLIFSAVVFSSCKEESDEVEEYPNWKVTNEAYIKAKYDYAQSVINGSWFTLKSYQYNDSVPKTVNNSVVVQVITTGTGTKSPIYSDSVQVNYRGYLLQSTSYTSSDDPELGLVFDESYSGKFSLDTARPSSMYVGSVVDGFATVLQKMHVGDRWKVYIPYQLGYSESGSGTIPGYSTLVFDIQLQAFCHAGETLPPLKQVMTVLFGTIIINYIREDNNVNPTPFIIKTNGVGFLS